MRPTFAPAQRPEGEILHEITRSICPTCRKVIDAQVLLRDEQVYMRKRCPEHGWFEGLIYADAAAYVEQSRYNKPGEPPARISTESVDGCPLDCGLCPEHRQHTCLALIEINTACNLDCPVCFANAGSGFNLSLAQVEGMLDRFVELEGKPEVVQFSGGEPTIHPELLAMIEAAQQREIGYVMVNTNGRRCATGTVGRTSFVSSSGSKVDSRSRGRSGHARPVAPRPLTPARCRAKRPCRKLRPRSAPPSGMDLSATSPGWPGDVARRSS